MVEIALFGDIFAILMGLGENFAWRGLSGGQNNDFLLEYTPMRWSKAIYWEFG